MNSVDRLALIVAAVRLQYRLQHAELLSDEDAARFEEHPDWLLPEPSWGWPTPFDAEVS